MLFSRSYYTSYDSGVLSSSRFWSPVIVSLALPTDITKLSHALPSVTLPTDIRALVPDKFLSVEITISSFLLTLSLLEIFIAVTFTCS